MTNGLSQHRLSASGFAEPQELAHKLHQNEMAASCRDLQLEMRSVALRHGTSDGSNIRGDQIIVCIHT